MHQVDIAIVGAGTAGMPAAIEAVAAGARVLVVDHADRVGGTLHVSAAQMSGAGTRLQAVRGIADDAAAHLADVLRISRGTCNPALAAKAVALAGPTIDWLMALGFDMDPACPAILHFHEAYRTPRTYWGRDGGRSVLKVLMPAFEAAMAAPGAQLRLGTRAAALTRAADGRVSGLEIDGPDGAGRVAAGSVVLASGGYGGSAARFRAWTGGYPLFTPALPVADGSGIALAEAIGARVQGGEHFIPTFAGIAERDGRVLWDHLPNLTPQLRPPWELYVDRSGRRFVREDIDSVDARERALMTIPDLTFWTVFDDRAWREAPPLLPGWSAADLDEAWRSHPSFVQAGSLAGLAAAAGIDAGGLAATVDAYNRALADAAPDPLGREHRPLPVAAAPFRAIRMHGIVLKTPAGLAVDDRLQVLDRDGAAIPGLYAVGEAIGGAALSGNAFVGGMSVTPALAFGRWLGQTLGRRRAVAA